MPKPLTVTLAPVLLAALAVGGCHRAARAPQLESLPPPVAQPAITQPDDGALADKDPLRKARQAVRDFVKETSPGSRVEGVWALPFTRNYCLAGADTTTGSQRRTVDLIVRLYVRENGSQYWRAESLDRGLVSLWSRSSAGEGEPAD